MVAVIDAHWDAYGVEPICQVLPIAPSLYYERHARQRDPEGRPPRACRDERLSREISRVWHQEHEVYGVRKVWKQLRREGEPVARCTVERLMRQLGLHGVVRGRTFKKTIRPDTTAVRPPDLVTRHFVATRPNQLWVADLTYVATWRASRDGMPPIRRPRRPRSPGPDPRRRRYGRCGLARRIA
jgi:transposase InsO family protein